MAETLPMSQGKSELREYNYNRHGTIDLFGNKNVATGEIVAPMLHPTRTEEDFAINIENVISTDPQAGWVFLLDNLNTHVSETLVLLVAFYCHISFDRLGKKGKYGILKDMKSRRKFLEDESHRIRFVYTPKHCSWLNQIENWFSGLTCRILRRGNFPSLDDLKTKILQYIEYYNASPKPVNWKYDPSLKTVKA
jgi:hypothetical protein